MRVKEIPQEQPLRTPQHLWHIPITVHMRIRVKGATTRRGARNTVPQLSSCQLSRLNAAALGKLSSFTLIVSLDSYQTL
jgi:hypothetical protein